MPTTTTNYALNKPLVNNATDQDLWGGYLNDNMDTIDTKLKLGIDRVIRTITTTDSVVAGDRKKTLLCDATSAAFTLTLLAAATAANGFELTIVKTDSTANAVTIDGNSSETIAGAATYTLSGQGDAATLMCDGSNWHFVGSKTTPSAVAAASTSAAGIIEIATEAEVQTGTSATLAVTPDTMQGALGFSKYYESAQQSYTVSTAITLTHSLGAVPKFMQVEFVCITTDGGYAADDKVSVSSALGQGTTYGISVAYNATKIMGIVSSSGMQLHNKSTGAAFTCDPTKWRIVFRAWA